MSGRIQLSMRLWLAMTAEQRRMAAARCCGFDVLDDDGNRRMSVSLVRPRDWT